MKLLGQVAILDRRIREHMVATASSQPDKPINELLLDTETFYTVAADALKLIGLFLMPDELKWFRADPTYKLICRIWSEMVRHAYDKPDGDTYSGFGYGLAEGLVLKAGSGRKGEPGYVANFQAFWGLLGKARDHNTLLSNATGT
jgi:hypothetical protein